MSSTTTTTITAAAVSLLKLDNENPRAKIDPERLAELTESIREHGIIQPLLVRPDGTGFRVVAGQRRLLAAVEAGLETVPVYVRDTNGDSASLAIVENLQREQLTPIEEAEAFKRAVDAGADPAAVARVISRSEQFVRDRLALLELPAKVQQGVQDGAVTLRAAAALRKLDFAGDVLLAAVADYATGEKEDRFSGRITVDEIERDPGMVLAEAITAVPKTKRPFLLGIDEHQPVDLDELPWPKSVDVKGLKAKADKLPKGYDGSYKIPRREALKLNTADVDAARAYGCLVELPFDNWRDDRLWITDGAWLADRLSEKIDKAIKTQERKAKAAAKKNGESTAPTERGELTDAEKAERKRVRDVNAEKRAQVLAARERNISLGIALYKGLHAPPVTADAMRVVAELVGEYVDSDFGQAGLRFVDEQSQTVETTKKGEITKVKHLRVRHEYSKLYRQRLLRAKSAEEILGVLLQAMVAARYVDRTAAPENDRYGHVRGVIGDRYTSINPDLVLRLDQIAEPVVPPAVAEAIREQIKAEAREREKEVAAEVGRIRNGHEACPNCGNGPKLRHGDTFAACDCRDDDIRAAISICPKCGEEECYASCSGFEAQTA